MLRLPQPCFRLLIGGFVIGAILAGGTTAHADEQAATARLQAENATLDRLENGALLELYALETRLGRAERELDALEARAADVEDRRRAARSQLEIARSAQATAQRQLGDRLTALYVEGDTDPLEILLGASSLDDVITALDGLERFADEDSRIIRQAERTGAALTTALRAMQREERELRASLSAAELARASLAAERDHKASYVDSLRERRSLNAREVASLAAAAEAAEARSVEIEASTEEPASAGDNGGAPEPAAVASLQSTAIGSPAGGRQLTVDAVAYSLPGHTASGLPVGKGVVAVDPTVIPLGTRMYVPGYGPAIAADVGTAIKGLIIDLWFSTYEQAAAWGRQTVTITIYP